MSTETTDRGAPTMDEKNALLVTLDKCEAEEWKALVRFCLPELVKEQELLADVLCREAERRARRASSGKAQHFPADHLASVLSDLGLRLEAA